MAVTERPGVYSSYEVTSAVNGSAAGGTVGCAALGAKGAELGIQRITSRAAAAEKFGTGGITELCTLALRNGAGKLACNYGFYEYPVFRQGTRLFFGP